MEHDPLRELDKYGQRKKQFYLHIGIFGFSTVVMYIFNKITEPENIWTIYISMVWLGMIALHYLYAFGVFLPKEKQVHNHHEEGKAMDELKLKEMKRDYRDSDLV